MNPLPLTLTAGLIVAGAAVHGAATYRWETLAPATGRADAVHAQAVSLSDYQSEEIPSEIEINEKTRCTCRRYLSAMANIGAVVSITSGPPGAVATHTPDVCYPSSGYRTLGGPRRETIALPGGGEATCYVAEFEKKTATRTERQRVRWAWATADGQWDAPDHPRFTWRYMSQPELYKLYVVTAIPLDESGVVAEDPPAVRPFVAAVFGQYAQTLAAY
jgi:hypothetical protein